MGKTGLQMTTNKVNFAMSKESDHNQLTYVMKSQITTESFSLNGILVLMCLLLAFPARTMAQEVDELQRLLDEYAARDAGKKKAKGMRKVDATTVPTDLQEIDLSKLTSYTKSTRTVTVKSDVKFVNGTIGAASNFSGSYLLNITEGATVVLGETATIDAGSLSCGSCLAAVNICGGSIFYQCGDVIAPDDGNCVAIRLDSKNDTYVYVSGKRKGTVQNNNGGTVVDNVLPGDVNNDGKVDVSDATSIFSWLLEHKPSVFVQSAADFNQDGTITVSDGVAIIASILDTPQIYLSCPDSHHPHMIDLGLPSGTKWACCNVGANKPEEYGGYYAWGETEEKDVYSEETYKYYQNGSYVDLGGDIAGTQYDVAHVKWGGSWVMPSKDQQLELMNNCTLTWTTQNNVSGMLLIGSNGGSIFLPPAFERFYQNLDEDPFIIDYTGTDGFYWSSTQDSTHSNSASKLYYRVFDYYMDGITIRCNGLPVRPVSR